MHSEEDGEGGKEKTKDHSSRKAVFSWFLGSQSLKINHKMVPYQQALWKGCTKKALTESNQQIQASGTSLELWLEQGSSNGKMRPKCNF